MHTIPKLQRRGINACYALCALRYARHGYARNFEKAVGGEGVGPGELTQFMILTRKGEDSLLVFDPMQSRVSILDRDGSFSRSFNVERPGRHTIERILPFIDGSYLLVPCFSSLLFMYDNESVVKRYPEPYLHLSSSGVVLDTFAIVPGSERLLIRVGESYFTSFGIMKIIRREIDLTISPSDIDKARKSVLTNKKGTSESTRITENTWRSSLMSQKNRPFSALIVIDPEGMLWVGNHQPYPKNYRPEHWSIFMADGRWLGDLSVPANFRVMDIGTNYVLGVQFDENEFESVRLFEIIKD